MQPLYLSSTLRRIEQDYSNTTPSLMQRAGSAAAKWLEANFPPQPVVIVAGPGNNGGDAFICAQQLATRGWPVNVHALPSERPSAEHLAARCVWESTGGVIESTPPMQALGLLIDGLFGIGQLRSELGIASLWIDAINTHSGPVIALDIPSGLDCDTGAVMQAAVHATHTLSFLGGKPGLYTAQARDHAGSVHLFDLGLMLSRRYPADALLVAKPPTSLPARKHDVHKGSHGTVGIIGGSRGMTGAALLAGRAALHCGAGKVYLGLVHDALAVDPCQPELMLQPVSALPFEHIDVLAIGPGLGVEDWSRTHLTRVLGMDVPLVIDADGLNLIASDKELKHCLAARKAPTVLTPHPAEAGRLLGCGTASIQSDRLGAAAELVEQYRCSVLLKGSGTICAAPGVPPSINASGNGALASAGQGDVLTGAIAALMAQGLPGLSAAQTAAYAHGAAADAWRRQYAKGTGLTASETLVMMREQLNSNG
ncbi:NAD(P)H-hydrate dehydratase [Chitiniphilus eburneus]|nr:NAD(P)H-hydrate dehydratase [Chitiniphilus eburneus]